MPKKASKFEHNYYLMEMFYDNDLQSLVIGEEAKLFLNCIKMGRIMVDGRESVDMDMFLTIRSRSYKIIPTDAWEKFVERRSDLIPKFKSWNTIPRYQKP
jgi:hypothetical protein